MELKETPNNPIPENAVCGMVEAADKVKLRFARFHSLQHPAKGTVLLLQGRAEFIEKLMETVHDLIGNGFDVVTFDWRGQGGSDRLLENRQKGYVDSFDQYILDLEAVMEQVALPDCTAPYYILAHSTGATVALLAAPRFGNRIRRMVLLSPLLGIRGLPFSNGTARFIAGALMTLGFGEAYVAGGATPELSSPFRGNRLTSDTRRYERNSVIVDTHREISIGGPTVSWLFAAFQAMEKVLDPDFHRYITIPTLLVQAGADEIIENIKIEELAGQLRSGSTLSITGAKHELMQERDVYREQMLAAFNTFVPGTEFLDRKD